MATELNLIFFELKNKKDLNSVAKILFETRRRLWWISRTHENLWLFPQFPNFDMNFSITPRIKWESMTGISQKNIICGPFIRRSKLWFFFFFKINKLDLKTLSSLNWQFGTIYKQTSTHLKREKNRERMEEKRTQRNPLLKHFSRI